MTNIELCIKNEFIVRFIRADKAMAAVVGYLADLENFNNSLRRNMEPNNIRYMSQISMILKLLEQKLQNC